MLRRTASALLLSLMAFPLASQVTPGPGLFGDRRFRAPIANEIALPATAQLGEVRLTLDLFKLFAWNGTAWVEVSGGGGGGEANTASNLGGGLANFSAKVGVDLQHNSFAAADFDLAANLLSIDPLKWAELADIPASLPPSGAAGGSLGGTYPNPTVDDDGHAHTGATLPAASTTAAGIAEFATSGEATAGLAVQGNDARLSDARTPTAHATTHQNAGADEVTVAGLSGLLADGQTPLAHASTHANGGADEVSVAGLSGALADPQTAAAHAASHQDGGADEISAAALSGQLADAQKVTARKNSGVDVGARSRLNLIEGSNVTITLADDGVDGELDFTIAAAGGGVTDHGALTGLSDDGHAQYALLAGRSGGQTLTGGAAASDPLILKSTSNAAKGQVRIGDGTTFPAVFQQLPAETTMSQVLINRATPVDSEVVHISGPGNASPELFIRDASTGAGGPRITIDRTGVPFAANQAVGSVFFCGANNCYNEIGVKSVAAWSGAGPSYFWVSVGDAAGNVNEVFRAANAEAGGTQIVAGGALTTKVKVGGTLNTGTTQAGNTAATETDLYSFSVPTSTLLTNGDSLHLDCGGTFAGSITTDKRLRVKYGGTTVFDSGALSVTSAASWKIQADVLRTGAATQKASVEFHSSSSVLAASAGYATAAETLSGAVTIKVTGQGTDASDVVGEWCKLYWRP